MSLSFYTYKADEWRRISETYLWSGTIFKFRSPIRSFPLQLLFDKLPPQIDRLVGGQTSRFETSLSGKIVVQRLQYQQTPHQWFPPVTLRRKSIARERRKGRPSLSFYGQWRSRWTLREVAQTFYNELIKRPSAGQLPLADKYTRMRATRSRMIAEFCNKSRLFITSRSYSSFVLHLLLPLLIFPFYKKKFPSFLFQFSSFKAERGIIATYRVVIRPTWRLSAENERGIRGGCWKKILSRNADFFFRAISSTTESSISTRRERTFNYSSCVIPVIGKFFGRGVDRCFVNGM